MNRYSLVSLIFFVCVVWSIVAGKTFMRGRTSSREEQPWEYWLTVGFYAVVGLTLLYIGHHQKIA